MSEIRIPKEEFEHRIGRIREIMQERDIDAVLVYGDEYRKENLRYVSNFWPIFERGATFIKKTGEPMVLCAPEGEKVSKRNEHMAGRKTFTGFPLCYSAG